MRAAFLIILINLICVSGRAETQGGTFSGSCAQRVRLALQQILFQPKQRVVANGSENESKISIARPNGPPSSLRAVEEPVIPYDGPPGYFVELNVPLVEMKPKFRGEDKGGVWVWNDQATKKEFFDVQYFH